MAIRHRTVWSGFFEVHGVDEGGRIAPNQGALFTALAVAADSEELVSRVRIELNSLGARIVSVRDTGRYPGDFNPPETAKAELSELAKLARTAGGVAYTTWHVFPRGE